MYGSADYVSTRKISKTHQVNMMGKIYSKCAMCNIWLGDLGAEVDRPDAEDALDLLSHYAG